MAESRHLQVPTFHFEEDTPSLDPIKKLKLYSSISSLSSIISTESQATFAGTTNELVTHLRSRHDKMQKETFTRMCNKHLNSKDQITDLFTDFRDGLKLIKLLQKLSNVTVTKPTKGKMLIHHMQNLNACVKFLIEHKVYLNKASISAENIAEGDERRTLGMIFMIFLRFMFTGTDLESQDYKGKKTALLLWCQRQTESYSNVNLKNFSSSWQDGLAFNALIHHFRPELIQYDELDTANPIECMNNAFNVAQKDLDVPRLLDAEDVVEFADERSMFFYVYSLYQYFNQDGKKSKASLRILSILRKALDFQRDSSDYEQKAREFVAWMEAQEIIFKDTEKLKSCNFDEILVLLEAHKSFLNEDLSEKVKEEIDLFGIYSELLIRAKSLNFTPYQAPPGLIPQDIDFQFEELIKVEHSYRLSLFLRLRQLEEINRALRRFDKKANLLNDQLKERDGEIPLKLSQDPVTCQTQLDKLIHLCTYFDTISDRFAPLENTLTTLKNLKYSLTQSKIQEKDTIDSAYNITKQTVQVKRSLFFVNIEYYKLKASYEEIAPSVNTIRNTFMKIKRDDFNLSSLSIDPTIAYTEIQVFEIVIDENISQIIQHISTLEKITRALPEKLDLLKLLQSLLEKYKKLRELIKPIKDHLSSLLQSIHKQNELNDATHQQMSIAALSNEDLEKLNSQFANLKSPNNPKDAIEFLTKLGSIRNNSLTVQKRVENLLSDNPNRPDLLSKSQELMNKCTSHANTCLNDGWLSLLLEELSDIITHLTEVKGKVNLMNRQANEGIELGQKDIASIGDFERDASSYPELLKSILVGCPCPTIALTPCPDLSEHPEVKAKSEKIESLLKYILSLMPQLLKRATEQQTARKESDKLGPKDLRKLLMSKQKLLDEMPIEKLDYERAKIQEDKLKEIFLDLGYFDTAQSPDGENLNLLSKLKRNVSEKQNKNKSSLIGLELKALLEAGSDYLQTKSLELDQIAENPSETKLEVFKKEIEKFQENLSNEFGPQIQNLDPATRKECQTLQDQIDSDCNNLFDRIIDLLKKAKDQENYQNLLKEGDLFFELCNVLNTPFDLELFYKDPIPTIELGDMVKEHECTEKQVSSQKPVYEKLINGLYHSGYADGRERGKEVQKNWQILQQTLSDNSKIAKFIALFLEFLKETIPIQNLVNRVNSDEIPQLQSQLSESPDFEETQLLHVKCSTLLELIQYVSNVFNSDEKTPKISKYKTESNNLIGADQTSRILTPKISLLEKSVSDAYSRITDLNSQLKCWMRYYVIERRATEETNWVNDMQPGIPQLSKRKLNDLTNWAESMKNWATENSALENYTDFPDEIRDKILTVLKTTHTDLSDFLDETKLVCDNTNEKRLDDSIAESVKPFEDKFDNLGADLSDIEPGDNLIENMKKYSYLSGLPNLLTKLEEDIKKKHSGSPLLEKIPDLKKQVEDLSLKFKEKEKWLKNSLKIDAFIELNRESNEQLDKLIPIEKCDLSQLEANKYKLKMLQIETQPCSTFLEELSQNPELEKQPVSFQEKFTNLKNSNSQLIERIETCEEKIPSQEEVLHSEIKLDQSLESLNEIEFFLSVSPKWNQLSFYDEYPNIVAEYVSGCDQNSDFDTKRNNIVLKSKDLTEQLIRMMNEFILEHKDKTVFIGVVDVFKDWLNDVLNNFNETGTEKPKHSTIAALNYFGFVLTEIAPELYNKLQEDCPSNVVLSEEIGGVWPLKQMFVSDAIQKMETRLDFSMFLSYIRESANRFTKIKDRIPKPSSFKDDIPLAKISPTLCNNSLTTAGFIYSENSKKYQTLIGSKLTPTQSTELSNGMQGLSQAYHELVETCKSVLLVAKSVIIRDPIVKKVRMLEKSNSELDQQIEKIAEQDSLPDEHRDIETLLVTQEMACKDLPILLAASRDPENSLTMDNIEDIQKDSVSVTKSLSLSKDVWSQTKVIFSRKDMLKRMEEKENECARRSGKLDEIDQEGTLEYWEKWCQENIDNLLNMEVAEPEIDVSHNEPVSLESSLAGSEHYSISDFTIADPASFDLDLSLHPNFAETYNLLDCITEESYEDSVTKESVLLIQEQIASNDIDEREYTIPQTEDGIDRIEDNIPQLEDSVYKIEYKMPQKEARVDRIEENMPQTEGKIHQIESPVDDTVEEVFVQERIQQVNTFDLSKIANFVYTQEPIDGDPARPSPIHRTLDLGDDSGEDSSYFEDLTIEQVVLSEGATYVKEGSEYEGMVKVKEEFVKEEVPVVECPFDFTALLADDHDSGEEQKKKHVSFNEEDVIISYKTTDVLVSRTYTSGKSIQGFLSRKQEFISENRKPMTRPWKDVFVVLMQEKLEFYKDPIEMTVSNPLFPELALSGATCEIPSDYTKKEFVFRVVSSTGASFLFQTRSPESLQKWITAISQTIMEAKAARTITRTHSLDLPSTGQRGSKLQKFFPKK